MVTWLIPDSVDSGHPAKSQESGCPNAFAFYIKLLTEQFLASSPFILTMSKGRAGEGRFLLGIGEEDLGGPMTTAGLTYNVPIGRSSTSLYGSLFASADGKLCTSYNRGLISKAKIKAIKYSIVIILGKQHPSSCCKTADIPITNLYLGPGDTECTQGKKSVYGNFCLFPIRKEVCVELISVTVAPSRANIGFLYLSL